MTTEPQPTNDLEALAENANYVQGVRDLADMVHVSPEVAGVLRDCADMIAHLTALRSIEAPCTDCNDTGITIQTERRCTCDVAHPPAKPDAPAEPTGDAGVLDRPAIMAAARFWWSQNMPGDCHCKSVVIGGDGRVTVYWQDKDESDKYTLPVDFAALRSRPASDDAVVDVVMEILSDWTLGKYKGCEPVAERIVAAIAALRDDQEG